MAVGPLSNVAAALAIDPAFVTNVDQLIIMGGAIDKSNITPSAEFNIWADPEAAAQVFSAGFSAHHAGPARRDARCPDLLRPMPGPAGA